MDMKQLFLILITMVCGSVHAQSNMNISDLFEGKVVPASQMVETRIRGKAISQYKLTYFHSVRFKADEALVKRVDHLAAKDFKENGYEGNLELNSSMISLPVTHVGKTKMSAGKSTVTQMYRLRSQGSLNRFLCYKVIDDVMTVIYLEGTVSSLDELKKIFKD